MYASAAEHLLAELRRFDLILLGHMSALRPANEASQSEHDAVIELLKSGSAGAEASMWGPVDDVEGALRRHVEAIRRDVQESLARGLRLPMVELCRALELDADALAILVLAAAPHLDRKYGRVFAYLQGHRAWTLPRVDLALDLFAGDAIQRFALRRSFEATGPLLRSGHVELSAGEDGDAAPLLDRTIHASPRIIRHLLSHDVAEPVVEAMRPVAPLVEATESQRQALARFDLLWQSDQRPGPIAVIVSEDPEGIVSGTELLTSERQVPLVAVDLARPSVLRVPIDKRVREAFREATLREALLCIIGQPSLPEAEREAAAREFAAALESFSGPCVLVGDLARHLPDEHRRRPVIELSAPLPESDERTELWTSALAGIDGEGFADPAALAWRYHLSAAEIRDAARMAEADARSQEGSWPELLQASLARACQTRSRRDLEALAQPIRPRGEWSDLILPDASLEQLAELVGYLRHHDLVFGTWGMRNKVLTGDGLAALFAGPPGTGKTMASALVARELGRELYRIDLAGVVSKYIGETEKNLDRVFAAAHRSNAVLFFDEADALFGKRTEVKDAHDRYANVETSYLLQKIEAFDGIVILATNFKKNVDEAFMRRMAVVVDFPMPDVAERLRLWETLLPTAMPREANMDLSFLAQRFEASGAHIKNAITTAAMLAAEEKPQLVRLAHLLRGVRREMQKVGRLVDSADFGSYRGLLEPATLADKATRSGGMA